MSCAQGLQYKMLVINFFKISLVIKLYSLQKNFMAEKKTHIVLMWLYMCGLKITKEIISSALTCAHLPHTSIQREAWWQANQELHANDTREGSRNYDTDWGHFLRFDLPLPLAPSVLLGLPGWPMASNLEGHRESWRSGGVGGKESVSGKVSTSNNGIHLCEEFVHSTHWFSQYF